MKRLLINAMAGRNDLRWIPFLYSSSGARLFGQRQPDGACALGRRDDDHAVADQRLEQPPQDHRVHDVGHLELVEAQHARFSSQLASDRHNDVHARFVVAVGAHCNESDCQREPKD